MKLLNKHINPCRICQIMIAILLILFLSEEIVGQDQPESKAFEDTRSNLWLGSYGNFRFTDKIFWAGEFHYRRASHNGIPMIGKMGQIYNRHGIKYFFSKKLNVTAGGVLRIDFPSEPGNSAYKAVVEPRFWYEFLFAMPFHRFMIYHRLRFEHRWKRSTLIGAERKFKTRYRYMFYMKIPINNSKLKPGTIYFAPNVELIMQTGKTVVDNPVEDLRIYPHFGYIINPRYSTSMGVAYTTGQSDNGGNIYRRRWILRMNVYISLDFRKMEEKIPEIKMGD